MKFKPNYLFIPLFTLAVAGLGGWFSSLGMPWYDANLIKPELTPPKWVFPVAWNTIFVLSTIAALILWNKGKEEKSFLWFFKRYKEHPHYQWIVVLLIANGVLNTLWSLLFFTYQAVGWALLEMVFLELTLIAVIILAWRISKLASLLLLPYAGWVGFATYLTFLIWNLN